MTKGTIMIAVGIIGILVSLTLLLILLFKREKKKEIRIDAVGNITIEMLSENDSPAITTQVMADTASVDETVLMSPVEFEKKTDESGSKSEVRVRPIETELMLDLASSNETELMLDSASTNETQLLIDDSVMDLPDNRLANETQLLKKDHVGNSPANETILMSEFQSKETELLKQ